MHKVMLLALALLIAGCTTPPGEDPGDDPNTDPGNDSGLPDQGSGDPGTRPADGERPPGFARQGHQAADEGSRFPGIHVQGIMDTCEVGFCLNATAVNEGTETVHVHDVCITSWSETMTRDGETVQHQEPRFYCAAFGTAPMEPGDRLFYNSTWDERIWDGEEPSSAPEGPYEWHITFRVFGSADGGDPEDIRIAFPVIVGET